jgi:hypothetical protein
MEIKDKFFEIMLSRLLILFNLLSFLSEALSMTGFTGSEHWPPGRVMKTRCMLFDREDRVYTIWKEGVKSALRKISKFVLKGGDCNVE